MLLPNQRIPRTEPDRSRTETPETQCPHFRLIDRRKHFLQIHRKTSLIQMAVNDEALILLFCIVILNLYSATRSGDHSVTLPLLKLREQEKVLMRKRNAGRDKESMCKRVICLCHSEFTYSSFLKDITQQNTCLNTTKMPNLKYENDWQISFLPYRCFSSLCI